MSATFSFVEHLLRHGEAVFLQKPAFPREERADLLGLLERAHGRYRLEIAGPLLPFAPEAALGAARFVTLACWSLVGDDSAETIATNLLFPLLPQGPESHLAADLTLRYLPTVHRRVRTRTPDDILHKSVADTLCRWPLSGALADVEAPPVGDLSFGNHFGLQLLYAERLAKHLRTAWIPPNGRSREAVELVLQQKGKALPC